MRNPLARLAETLESRPDSEHELTLSRLALSLVAFLALFIGHLAGGAGQQSLINEIGLYFILFTLVTIALFAHLVWHPGVSVMRRLIGIPLDIGGVAYLMHRGDELTAFTYPIFLWAIFGNGFRFGVNYLFAAAGVGFACFLAVIATTPFWSDNRELSIGLLAGLVVLPTYVSMLIRRLSEARLQAEAASRAKSLFLASISHELRTPLNAVIGLSDLLVGTRLDRKQMDMARTIGKSGRSLLSLINALLDVSRMEFGKKPQMGEFDLHDMLRDICAMLSVQADSKGVPLALHIDPALPRHIVGSTRHFEEVLINLVGNAVKFTAQGYVLVEAKVLPSQKERAHRLRFEITDTGIGIAPQAQAHIFESFTQADETIIDRFGGTGLGLSIARQLVGAHGGAIGVTSEMGAGSTFWFEIEGGAVDARPAPSLCGVTAHVVSRDAAVSEKLCTAGVIVHCIQLKADFKLLLGSEPEAGLLLVDERMIDDTTILSALDAHPQRACLLLSADASRVNRDIRRRFFSILPASLDDASLSRLALLVEETGSGGVETTEAPARALDILVAEDNRTNQMVISQILSRSGHSVTMVENGERAVDALFQNAFDFALMDLNMPVMNGFDAAKRYAFAMLGQKATPIVALTADATPETAARCREAGMAECLNKPIEPQNLLAVVAKYAAQMDALVAPTGAIDRRALSDLADLGGAQFVRDIVAQFVADAAAVLQDLHRCAQGHDVEGFRDHAHALRSCAANVGAQAVYRMCLGLREIEAHELAAQGARHVRDLEQQFERAKAELAVLS